MRKPGDVDAFTRRLMGAIGSILVWFGNRMSKNIAPAAWGGQAHRVGGGPCC